MRLDLTKIRVDGGTQARVARVPGHVEDLAAVIRDGGSLPEIVVFRDGDGANWLADGFHRIEAARMAGNKSITVDLREGSRRDAVLFACGANAAHGLKRTIEDKRRAVGILLADPEWAAWSSREIARRCSVSDTFVSSMREAASANVGRYDEKDEVLPASGNSDRKAIRNGVEYTVDTTNIGKATPPERPANGYAVEDDDDACGECGIERRDLYENVTLIALEGMNEGFICSVCQDPSTLDEHRPDDDSDEDPTPKETPNGDLAARQAAREADEAHLRAEAKKGQDAWNAKIEQESRDRKAKAAVEAEKRRAAVLERREARRKVAAAGVPGLEGVQLDQCSASELLDELEDNQVALVFTDPPWKYDNNSVNGAADAEYPTMDMEDIVRDLARAYGKAVDHAYLLMWITSPMLRDWFERADTFYDREVPGGWEWKYQTTLAWVKTGSPGIGFHARGQHELILVYTKGTPRPLTAPVSVYAGPRVGHSCKPDDWLRDLVNVYADEEGVVLDPYAGLGSLARACAAKGRRYLGAEIDPTRHAAALASLEQAKPLFQTTGNTGGAK